MTKEKKPNAVVAIPVVQADLRDFEKKSLDQCLKVLGDWPICLISPDGLDLSAVLAPLPLSPEVIRFPAEYFRSIADYNRLMTSPFFYKAFGAYEFMLLYQLDAYVFEDRLSEWCKKGYDYVGAPAFDAEGFDALQAGESEAYAHALASRRLVFNGGLSLRKIATMIRLLTVHNFIYPSWKGNEDMLFSLSSTRLIPFKPFIKLPRWKEALGFAFEKSPAASYRITGGALPFGCHAWPRYDPGFWEGFIG